MTEETGRKDAMAVEEILAVLPHRYPFLLVDRILEVGPDRILGLKNVTINEPYFPGHVPGQPVMPGVLIVEAMAQVAACLILNRPHLRGRLAYFAGIDRCRFRRPVFPGDTLRIEVEMRAVRGRIGKVWAVARVEEQVVAEGELTFALPPEATWGADGRDEGAS
ncbi:MAG: 3-hydroxyacyl-ACP dehydratase FabZ [Armatimonadota bacterium]|nr:3-hydroxyacyl-ACP dehydratase FabZ [Armatimonadota bacterium]MDR7449235.1 3-hydroxyacyl-ACP dehydratase FabZ [Armatimonadota bacterium]MDR7459299.1 3-hydroxyacyl-ACP dehydratase FabZ [Armatimonadota bacterium]MDR7478329.1 3-hydroxyacyl-ACP dehydratase FabZ [Armatimonadota bacterium]MDR7487228.1 3-hydroxyacyl-ACP dehydratase FabZ [Armatimonadota bacterium]